MKRLWKWVRSFFSSDSPFVFYKQNLKKYGEGRLAVQITQRIYRRRCYLRRIYWYGTIHVKMRVVGVRLIHHVPGYGEVLGKVLYATEDYVLRRDMDYIFLLHHLLFLRDTCNLTNGEQLFLLRLKEVFMELWPPHSNVNIQVCVYDTQNGCDGIS